MTWNIFEVDCDFNAVMEKVMQEKQPNNKPLLGFFPFESLSKEKVYGHKNFHDIVLAVQRWWRNETGQTLEQMMKEKGLLPSALPSIVAPIYLHGVAKHGDTWRTKSFSEHYHALCRHAFKLLVDGIEDDSESKHSHRAHILTRLEMIMLCEKFGTGVDDRPKQPLVAAVSQVEKIIVHEAKEKNESKVCCASWGNAKEGFTNPNRFYAFISAVNWPWGKPATQEVLNEFKCQLVRDCRDPELSAYLSRCVFRVTDSTLFIDAPQKGYVVAYKHVNQWFASGELIVYRSLSEAQDRAKELTYAYSAMPMYYAVFLEGTIKDQRPLWEVEQKKAPKRPHTWLYGGKEQVIEIKSVNDLPTTQEIAHGLSGIPRWSGQPDVYYSVANHSLWVYRTVKELGGNVATQLWALLHDAHECIYNDVSSPVKKKIEAREYEKLCDGFDHWLKTRCGLSEKLNHMLCKSFERSIDYALIKSADNAVGELEAQLFMGVSKQAAEEHFADVRDQKAVSAARSKQPWPIEHLNRYATKISFCNTYDALRELL